MTNSMDPDQARIFVGLGLVQNSLQRWAAGDKILGSETRKF